MGCSQLDLRFQAQKHRNQKQGADVVPLSTAIRTKRLQSLDTPDFYHMLCYLRVLFWGKPL